MRFQGIKIASVGRFLPPRVITNEELSVLSPVNPEWTEKNLGIKARRSSLLSVVDSGYHAAIDALYNANRNVSVIDAVIVSCSSPSHNAPPISSQIINELGIQVPAFDINAVCAGFVYALEMGCHLINSGEYSHVLIVATEQYSSITDWFSRDCVYFGDGAGAILLQTGEGTISTRLYADGLSGDAFVSKVGEKFTMKGRMVYDQAMKVLPPAVDEALRECKLSLQDIDHIIPHQAGYRLIEELMKTIGYDMGKCVTVMDKYANIASASIPIALNEIEWKNKTLMFLTIGAGWAWGTAIIEQPKMIKNKCNACGKEFEGTVSFNTCPSCYF